MTSPCTGYIAQSLFHTVAGRLPPAARLLDVACGNGELSRAAVLHCLAEREASGEAGSVLATDFSLEMVKSASQNIGALNAGDLVRCEVRDGQSLGLESSTFDAVFSAFGIFLFPDRHAAWREAARVLKPGALLATAVWRGPEDNALARLQMLPVMAALPDRLRSLPRPGWFDITSREGLRNELMECGFTDVDVTIFDAVLTAPTPSVMWEMMLENPPTQSLLGHCTQSELVTIKESVLSNFEAMAGGQDRPVSFNASCHFAVARSKASGRS